MGHVTHSFQTRKKTQATVLDPHYPSMQVRFNPSNLPATTYTLSTPLLIVMTIFEISSISAPHAYPWIALCGPGIYRTRFLLPGISRANPKIAIFKIIYFSYLLEQMFDTKYNFTKYFPLRNFKQGNLLLYHLGLFDKISNIAVPASI